MAMVRCLTMALNGDGEYNTELAKVPLSKLSQFMLEKTSSSFIVVQCP